MKNMLKLLSVVCIFFGLITTYPTSAMMGVVFEANVGILRPTVASQCPAFPDFAQPIVPPIDVLPPIFGPQFQEASKSKYVPKYRADRKTFISKKEAYEAAKRAGGGKEPRHDPHGHDKETRNSRGKQTNKKPHYHPASSHDHYYYTHRVVAGDTLSGIAKKYNTTYQKLAEINGIKNPNLIRVGQIIKIPK